ncbi:MAG TPA: ATP-binding protein [Roseiflexaceae bacterium]|jgi:signal transduction histidine kinase|nr:ATP-binding protein [Roseiflexaceae bacterium]
MDRRQLHILLVDDDEDDYILTRDLLADATNSKHVLDWADNYEQGAEIIARQIHDVYLVDYRLGARSGLDLAREAMRKGCRVPIIMLTGQGDDEVGMAAMQAGAADYLVKGRIDAQLLERAMQYAIERKRAEDARIQLIWEQSARAEAEAAVRMRDQFLSIAAHELKTPLTSLLGNVQLLQRRSKRDASLGERNVRVLNVIYNQTVRLNRMIEALLDISRLETGQLTIARQALDINELVRRVAAEIEPSLDQHTLEVHGPSEPIMITGDDLRLEQVLQNLIQNGIKYSPHGGTVAVSISQDATQVQITVTDPGIGIPKEALGKLFTRFYRAPNATEHQIHGMGVGLYVVAEIVRLHGGQISVTSRENQGSTFTVTLPLSEQLPAPSPAATSEMNRTA